MTKYREILRISSLGFSQQSIADSCNVSKKTLNRVLKRAKELYISWPLDANQTDAVLAEKLFPSDAALEAACTKALCFTAAPSYKSVKNILSTGSYQSEMPETKTESTNTNQHGITRGADYYRR